MRCFLCKKNNFEIAYKLKTKNILRCKNDGLFVTDVVTASKNIVYEKDYFDNAPHPLNSNRKYFLNKLLTIRQITNNDFPNILDIGCGWGEFEEVLEMEKIPYLGIDISKESIKICQKKGLNCKQITIEKLVKSRVDKNYDSGVVVQLSGTPPQNDVILATPSSSRGRPESIKRFDAITLFQVIEHVKNPIPLLQSAKKLLKKNGVILITTPNNDSPLRKVFGSRWSIYNEPGHHVFYNRKTLKKTLKSTGFRDIKVKLDSIRFLSSRYILKRLKEMFFPNIKYLISNIKLNFPIPTDPLGDLSAIASV